MQPAKSIIGHFRERFRVEELAAKKVTACSPEWTQQWFSSWI